MKSAGGGKIRQRNASRVPRRAASSCGTGIASPIVIHPRRRRGNGTAPGDGFWGKERIPGVRHACGEGGKGMRKAREAFYPIAGQ